MRNLCVASWCYGKSNCVLYVGVGEMAQWTQHLLGEPEDQSFNPQCPHEAEYSGTLL